MKANILLIMKQKMFFLLVFTLLATFLNSCNQQEEIKRNESARQITKSPPANRLEIVKKRKKLICGVHGGIKGFSFKDENDRYSGIDVDICRAVAAALFDDPEAVEYKNLSANDRFTAVSTGDVDILSRNTTWTLKRDATLKVDFAAITFYDGQGLMVRNNSGIKKWEDLNNKSICVTTGTTSELNLYDEMEQRGVIYNTVRFLEYDNAVIAYKEKRCQAITFDRSQLFARKLTLEDKEKHHILEDVISKEPLGPAVLEGDSRWFKVVRWVTYATIEAEELGINSQNLEEMKKSPNPRIRRFLGVEGDLGLTLGLDPDFTDRIIYHVGNYQEIYDRNLGADSELQKPRGQNQLWKNGGLLYSPPFR